MIEPATSSPIVLNEGSENIPDIATEKIRLTARQMKNRNNPGEDSVRTKVFKSGSKVEIS